MTTDSTLSASPTTSSKRRVGAVASALLGALALLGTAAPAAAASSQRTIFHHGKIFTADPANPWAEAIVVQYGKVISVGSNWSVGFSITPGSRVIDLEGRTVIPGLNDAHVHALSYPGVYLNTPDFVPGPGPTAAEVEQMIEEATAVHPPGTWLVVLVGTNISDDPNVDRFSLDTFSPDHPVKLEAWSGHGTWLNTRAMEALDIAEDEPDPFGGEYARVPGTSILTGVAHEYAEHHVRRRLLSTQPDSNLVSRYHAFADDAVKLGFTSIQDMAVGMTRARSTAVLGAANLPIRVRSICFPLALDEPCEQVSDTSMLSFSGVKWVTDGTPIERRAYLETSYLDKPGWIGAFNFAEAPLQTMLLNGQAGSRKPNQTLFHAVGDGALNEILDGMDETGGASAWSSRRLRIEHGDLLFPENIPRAKALGMVIVQNPTHFALTQVFAQRLAPTSFAMMEPLKTLLTSDVPLAFGTDAIGRVGNPWLDVFFAVVHPTRPTEAITVAEAIMAYTRGSAYAEMEESRKGTLTQWKAADLVVLSQDVFTVPVTSIPTTTSVLTMVDGDVVWSDGSLGI